MNDIPTDPDVRSTEAHRYLFLNGLASRREFATQSDCDLVATLTKRFEMDVNAEVSRRELFWLRQIAQKESKCV